MIENSKISFTSEFKYYISHFNSYYINKKKLKSFFLYKL